MLQEFRGLDWLLRSWPPFTKFNAADFASERPREHRGENRDYRKFIVLAHQRSGSSLVISSLCDHPQVVAYSELFAPRRFFFYHEAYDDRSPRLLRYRNARPREFLDKFIYGGYSEHVRAVGFKLFPDQIAGPRFGCIWKWIARNPDLKIIYLRRRNLLATYASLLVAMKDKRYAIKDESQRSMSTIKIDPKACLAEFRKRTRYERMMEGRIQKHDALHWSYENLAASPQEHLRVAQQFIGVDVRELKIKLVKQELRPLYEVIENYGELERYFAGTEWEYLFHEPSVNGATAPERFTGKLPRPNHCVPGPADSPRINSDRIPNRWLRGREKFFRRPAITGSAIAIGLLVVGLFLTQLFSGQTSGEDQTVSTIGQIATRIKGYAGEHQALPTKLAMLPAANDASIKMHDAWNRQLDYAVVNPNTFEIRSYGADGMPGGSGDASDIVLTYRLEGGEMKKLH